MSEQPKYEPVFSPRVAVAIERRRPDFIQVRRDQFGKANLLVLIFGFGPGRKLYYFHRGLRCVKSLLEDDSAGYFTGSRWPRTGANACAPTQF